MKSILNQQKSENGKRSISDMNTEIDNTKKAKLDIEEKTVVSDLEEEESMKPMTRSRVKKLGVTLAGPLGQRRTAIKIGDDYQADIPEWDENIEEDEEREREEPMNITLCGNFSEIESFDNSLSVEEEKNLKIMFKKSRNFVKKARETFPDIKPAVLVRFYHEEERLKTIEIEEKRKQKEAEKQRKLKEKLEMKMKKSGKENHQP